MRLLVIGNEQRKQMQFLNLNYNSWKKYLEGRGGENEERKKLPLNQRPGYSIFNSQNRCNLTSSLQNRSLTYDINKTLARNAALGYIYTNIL